MELNENPLPPKQGPSGPNYGLYRLAWIIWSVGTVLIVLSWTDTVSATIGWVGFVIAFVGVAISALAHGNWPRHYN